MRSIGDRSLVERAIAFIAGLITLILRNDKGSPIYPVVIFFAAITKCYHKFTLLRPIRFSLQIIEARLSVVA